MPARTCLSGGITSIKAELFSFQTAEHQPIVLSQNLQIISIHSSDKPFCTSIMKLTQLIAPLLAASGLVNGAAIANPAAEPANAAEVKRDADPAALFKRVPPGECTELPCTNNNQCTAEGCGPCFQTQQGRGFCLTASFKRV